ncbi:MAG: MauE/DoxX family redox-associated membrane protein [Syntrophaceae bacterium]|nr:MauE/DoxX family redox-associated membrane protein [Syntrophaceae bacterium]
MEYKGKGVARPYSAGIAYHSARWILGVVFIYASIHKILDPAAFARAVYLYRIFPDGLVNLAALVLPWVELFLGVLLIIGIWMPGAAVLSTFLFMVFMGALSYNVARGLDISCGCFSTSTAAGGANIWTIVRDGMFLTVSLYLLCATFGVGALRVLRKQGDS